MDNNQLCIQLSLHHRATGHAEKAHGNVLGTPQGREHSGFSSVYRGSHGILEAQSSVQHHHNSAINVDGDFKGFFAQPSGILGLTFLSMQPSVVYLFSLSLFLLPHQTSRQSSHIRLSLAFILPLQLTFITPIPAL